MSIQDNDYPQEGTMGQAVVALQAEIEGAVNRRVSTVARTLMTRVDILRDSIETLRTSAIEAHNELDSTLATHISTAGVAESINLDRLQAHEDELRSLATSINDLYALNEEAKAAVAAIPDRFIRKVDETVIPLFEGMLVDHKERISQLQGAVDNTRRAQNHILRELADIRTYLGVEYNDPGEARLVKIKKGWRK